MAKRSITGPESRAPLTRERVLRAAVALADEEGIDSLTMRELGLRLGVEAMSLYNHVANKDDILDGMVDLVVGRDRLACRPGGLEGGHAAKGDIRPSGLLPSPLGERSDRLSREQRACAATVLGLGA